MGYIIVKRDVILPVGGPTNDDVVVITVTTQPKPNSLTAKSEVETTIPAAAGETDDHGDGQEQQEPVRGDERPATDVRHHPRQRWTARASTDGAGTAIAEATDVQWCQVYTAVVRHRVYPAGLGTATVTLKGGGREGTATVTISHGRPLTRPAST